MSKARGPTSRKLMSPSPYDPTVSYDDAGSALNGQIAVLAGTGMPNASQLMHTGVSPAIVGSLADFEDSHGRSIAERAPENYATDRRQEEFVENNERAANTHLPQNNKGLECYEVDRHGCWLWMGAVKGKAMTPTFRLKSARRLIYLEDFGLSEDEAPGRFVHAACGERRCVSPDHALWHSGSRIPRALARPELRAG